MEPEKKSEEKKRAKLPHIPAWLLPLLVCVAAVWLFLEDTIERDVFSWMDPWQYFGMGQAIAAGAIPAGGFEVPTIFPFFVSLFLAMEVSVPSALLTNLVFLLIILGAAMWLMRELQLPVNPGWVGVILLASPLLYGLSRELYSETALTAMITLAYCAGFRWLRTDCKSWAAWAGLAGFAGLAVAIKITAPLFFIGPFLVLTFDFLRRKQWADWAKLCATFAVGFGIALAGLWLAMPNARPYFLSLGNTEIPIMHLIGPPERWSVASFLYYPRVLLFYMLGHMSVLLFTAVLLVFFPNRFRRKLQMRILLWSWFLVPILLLILQETKEPRHILPCLIPLSLLMIDSLNGARPIGAKPIPRWVVGVIIIAIVFPVFAQTWLIPSRIPYYLKGATHFPELLDNLQAEAPVKVDDELTTPPPLPLWAYRRNIVITGFDPDKALALAWLLRPAVVIDLDSIPLERAPSKDSPAIRYEDPFLYSVFAIYNRRTGSPWNWGVLRNEEIFDNADIFIMGSEFDSVESGQRSRDALDWVVHENPLLETEIYGMKVLIMRPAEESYRALINEVWLSASHSRNILEDAELRAVRQDFMTEFLLTTDGATLENPDKRREFWGLTESYPGLFEPEGIENVPAKNIYWFGIYGQINQWRQSRLEALVPEDVRPRDDIRSRIDKIYADPAAASTTGL